MRALVFMLLIAFPTLAGAVRDDDALPVMETAGGAEDDRRSRDCPDGQAWWHESGCVSTGEAVDRWLWTSEWCLEGGVFDFFDCIINVALWVPYVPSWPANPSCDGTAYTDCAWGLP